MKKFVVSLDIITYSQTLDELSSYLGISSANGSHNMGETSQRPDPWPYTIWKCDSKIAEELPLREHFQSLFKQLPVSRLMEKGILPSDRQIYLNIAVMFYDAMCSIEIPSDCIAILHGLDVTIELSCYPSVKEDLLENKGQR